MELLLARNPEPDSSLPWLLRLPVDGGLVFRVEDTWPRTTAVSCHPVPRSEWPAEPVDLQQIPLRVCERRGAAIGIVADRGREQRSQVVFTRARGRAVVFWQAPRTRKQARPGVRVPTARASGLSQIAIVIDSHERYPYTFVHQQATTSRRALACGYLAAAQVHLTEQDDATRVVGAVEAVRVDEVADEPDPPPAEPVAPPAVIRAWALAHGLPVAGRGRVRPETVAAWRAAHGRDPG